MRLHSLENAGRVGAALRWTAAGLLVAAAHAGAGWWVMTHPISQAKPPDEAQGILIDLEPVAVPQNAPEQNDTPASGAAPMPQSEAAPEPPPTPPPEPQPTPPEAVKPPVSPPDPQPLPETPPPGQLPPEPAPVEEPRPVPDLDPTPVTPPSVDSKSEAVLAPSPPPIQPPKPKPVVPRLQPPKPDPRQLARQAAERRAVAERKAEGRAARAQARAAEAREAGGPIGQASAPSSMSSGAAVATWRGAVKAHLDAFRSQSPNGASGTARVAFSVDRSGRVLSASLAGSSGDGALDAAAVALVRRASPVPGPPPEMGSRVGVVAPIRFR